MRPMRLSPMLATVLAAAMPLLAACIKGAPSDLDSNGNGGSGAGGDTSGGSILVDDAPALDKTGIQLLDSRPKDYNEALRTASLKLVRQLPTLAQIKSVAGAADQKVAYEDAIDAMLADTRFNERMIKWWKDVMRMGGAANGKTPSRDSAPIFAARIIAEGRPFTDLFTASANNCPSYDGMAHAFVDGTCQSGAPAEAGVLTDPGVMFQFYGSMAFRRVRWVQEIFACTKFPAEYAAAPIHKGAGDYISPWAFESVGTAPIDFQDTKSVICANCHTTINHIAPLFANFDADGAYQNKISVTTPTAPDAVPTEMSHWLRAGETTNWRMTTPAADLPALGAAIANDPDISECAVARMWNFTMSKEDIVSDLSTVPAAVLKPYLAEFEGNGKNLKKTLRAMLTSDDFTSF